MRQDTLHRIAQGKGTQLLNKLHDDDDVTMTTDYSLAAKLPLVVKNDKVNRQYNDKSVIVKLEPEVGSIAGEQQPLKTMIAHAKIAVDLDMNRVGVVVEKYINVANSLDADASTTLEIPQKAKGEKRHWNATKASG
ncbi:unnamed protein product [Haemonchus placei]|uniref:Mu-like prophage major head subunit gpT n=1 Tax=Haemonchus placei TaxID=6290 RepID=A0A0N4X765_HAEPC|nr:unnamed protein product [Haemonchus placei]